MGSFTTMPASAGAMPLAVWRGEKGQRLRRVLSRHERMVTRACSDDNATSERLNQLNNRYDRIILAAITWVPR
ncbi:hypothetical protein E0H95_30085 [Pseudomonas syringae pv. tomato]|nr:hypothetical protein [Pseudomonas syringae pv. tomato]